MVSRVWRSGWWHESSVVAARCIGSACAVAETGDGERESNLCLLTSKETTAVAFLVAEWRVQCCCRLREAAVEDSSLHGEAAQTSRLGSKNRGYGLELVQHVHVRV